MEVFWLQGFDNASLSELTSAMGLRPPSLYAAFGSKEALFREAVEFYVRTQGDGIWSKVSDGATAREGIAQMLRATACAYTRGTEPRGCMIVLSAPQMQGASPEVSEELRRRRAENVAILERRLDRAVAEGEIPSKTDCRSVAGYFATVQHGMSIQARDGASRKELLATADCAMAGWDRLVGNTPEADVDQVKDTRSTRKSRNARTREGR